LAFFVKTGIKVGGIKVDYHCSELDKELGVRKVNDCFRFLRGSGELPSEL
jgi:hypothetical protein